MTKKTRDYKPIQDLLLALSEICYRSGISLREIARKLEKDGFNLYNVCSMANGHPEQMATIVKYDSYLNAILKATGHDEFELLERTLKRLTDPDTTTYQDTMSPKIREFIRNPESEKYLEFAYKKYRLDKLAEEQEAIKKELEDM